MNPAAITHDVHYPYPPERVWRALTTSAVIAWWLMPNDFASEVGRSFTFTITPRPDFGFDAVHCQVTACNAPSLLAYTWNFESLRLLVTYRLEPEDGGTRLHFEQSGFDLDNPADADAYLGLQGWHDRLDERLPREIAALGAV
ncbi:MAG: SRPBCC family protein [Ktedonobacterales bacterium]